MSCIVADVCLAVGWHSVGPDKQHETDHRIPVGAIQTTLGVIDFDNTVLGVGVVSLWSSFAERDQKRYSRSKGGERHQVHQLAHRSGCNNPDSPLLAGFTANDQPLHRSITCKLKVLPHF